ncbi:MAG: rubredoxin [Sphingobacterium sp.]|uniref:rubredoxin n=1 Tax=Sphingobacterium sp. JB170 TaxID=1434842 RepID=UPI00097EC47E|nr:rubredoxin [Sphingobacterium sp. JB170]SJN45643.1 Rubredoxin [Sphingobacterium sp. JB170]
MLVKENKELRWVSINFIGGVVAVGELLTLVESLDDIGIHAVRFGTRQQMLFQVTKEELSDLEYVFLNLELPIEVGIDFSPNIVSSYVGEGIFNKAIWLREGVYKDILEGFDFTPDLKVNIVDGTQSFVPFFTGNLNFVCSEISNYWYLYIRFPKTNNFYCWNSLVYSGDIAPLSAFLDKKNSGFPHLTGAELETAAVSTGQFLFQSVDVPFQGASFKLPYYEGFNTYHDKLWLGIYRRNEDFSMALLKDICMICQETRIAQLYTTPWKSLIIKDICTKDRPLWDSLLDKHRINLRHALNELNWQLGDLCNESLKLKQMLVQYLNQLDVRTYKLCFGIKIKSQTGVWGSVIISRSDQNESGHLYKVEHTVDFDPNSKKLLSFREKIPLEHLGSVLLDICEYFYLNQQKELAEKSLPRETREKQVSDKVIHQCSRCLTVYDAAWGDPQQGVEKGVPFDRLSNTYRCSLCGAQKSEFSRVSTDELYAG